MTRAARPRFVSFLKMTCAASAAAVISATGAWADSPTIVLINPNSNAGATESMAALAQEAAGDAAQIVGLTHEGAPALLTTPADMTQAANGVLEIGKKAISDDGAAAIIVSAFSDPGLAELRAAMPDAVVVGIGEEAFHEAARDGRSYAVATITPDPALLESFKAKADELGYGGQYRGAFVTPGEPTQLLEKPEQLDAALAEAVNQAVSEGKAEAVIMGGGPLSASAVRIQPQVSVPLVVAVTSATQAVLKKLGQP